MSEINNLRTSLQSPRKQADAWYGKWMARRLSIYVTWFFSRLGLKADHATLLSLVCALIGIIGLGSGKLGIGILSLNLWYILDHVDGELARLQKSASLSGTFFDTSINFVVQPFTFLGLGYGLTEQIGRPVLWWGATAAVSSLMLLAIPVTEEAILFNESVKKGVVFQRKSRLGPPKNNTKPDWFRKSFRFIHTWVTFPSVLCAMTFGYAALLVFVDKQPRWFNSIYLFLVLYTVTATAICVIQIFYKIYFRTLDNYWKPSSGL